MSMFVKVLGNLSKQFLLPWLSIVLLRFTEMEIWLVWFLL